MNSLLKSFYVKPLVAYLVIALIALSTVAGPAEAMFVPAGSTQGVAAAPAVRAADLARVQTALESKIIRQKLMDYGLSPEDALTRLNKLSDEQIHQLAAHTDSLQAGGDPVDFLIGLVILGILVVVLIFLLQGRIEVRHK